MNSEEKMRQQKKKENKTEECCLKTDKTNSYHIKWHLGGLEQCLHHVPQAPACSRNVAEAEVCHIADRSHHGPCSKEEDRVKRAKVFNTEC